jgi:hypothetical protein
VRWLISSSRLLQFGEGFECLLQDGGGVGDLHLLLEVAYCQLAGPLDGAGGGVLQAGDDLHQCRFAGAVPAGEADPFLPGDEEGDLVQEDEAAEEQGYVVYGDHLAGFFLKTAKVIKIIGMRVRWVKGTPVYNS